MEKNVLDFFFKTVAENPGKIAIVEGDKSLNFGELKDKAINLAVAITAGRNLRNVPVAVFLPKSIECVVADLAVTLSCNPYMNLDVKSPAERIKSIFENVQPAVVITNNAHAAALEFVAPDTIILNMDALPTASGDESGLLKRLEAQIDTDPLCIINTSGSTGTPKGVVLNHRSYINYTRWAVETFRFDGTARLGLLSPTIFDHYNYELCLMMMTGAELVLLDNNMAMFPIKLLEVVKSRNINYIFWVPTIMVNIANMDLLSSVGLPELKMVWFAGEVFPTKQFNYWRNKLPGATFVNLYGPTETTVDCTYYVVNRVLSDNEPIPIGFPCRNTDVLILKENNEPATGEEEGELCVRGTSLAMGYFNNPEKTAEAFVQNPLNKHYPELIYRTGDVVSRNSYGEIVFRGRKDSLIKHLGYRIELGEVEHIIVNNLKLVSNACALYNYAKKEIALVYEHAAEIPVAQFRKGLMHTLPKYMIPTLYYHMASLPRNSSGKIDRALLKQKFV